MHYKLLFVDIDGTLFDHKSQTIHPSTIYALHKVQETGIQVFLSSGRNYYMSKELGVMDAFPFDGAVFLNGGVVKMKNQIIQTYPIANATQKKLVEYALKHQVSLIGLKDDEIFLSTPRSQVLDGLFEYLLIAPPPYKVWKENDAVQFLMAITEEHDQELLSLFKDITLHRFHKNGLDIMNLGNSKALGIQTLLEQLDVKPEECIAIGDGGNDIEMLSYVGLKIAMGNANLKLKSIADFVTTKVTEEGIYDAIKHYQKELGIQDFDDDFPNSLAR